MDCFLLTIAQDLEEFDSDYIQTKLCDNLRHGYVLSYLKEEGFNARRYNSLYQNFSIRDLKIAIEECKPGLLVFSVNYLGLSDNFEETLKIIKKLKKDFPKIHISLEGTFSTINSDYILNRYEQFIDSVIIGEPELIIPQLVKLPLRKISGVSFYSEDEKKIIKNRNEDLIEDLDTLPLPDRTNLNKVLKRGGVAQIRTSRGCNTGCKFCYLNDYYDKCGFSARRERSSESVVEELKFLIEERGCKEIWFADEDIIGSNPESQKRIREIANRLIEKNYSVKLIGQISAKNVNQESLSLLKKAGLKRFFMGIESGSQDFLNKMNKGLSLSQSSKALKIMNEVGIFCELGFIMFHPDSTRDKMKKDMDFLEKHCVSDEESYLQIYNLNRLTPKPQKKELGYAQNKDDLLSEEVEVIYNGVSWFSFKTRKINNYLRELQLDADKESLALKMINYYNKSIINLLKKLLAQKDLNNKQAFKIANKSYKELVNKLKSTNLSSEIFDFSS